ncbi:MAG: GTP 3',8-cyclase MoaA [Cyclobacteriaceae bacterium]|nr:GTP 3',8-cyclase MoaA [Cyclobacteriaceae bacterium]
MLFDNHGRQINYVRIAVTDRCNLRCFYCMPEEGIQYMPKKNLLSFEEIVRLVTLLAKMGISKVRFTGGEPFVRKDFMRLVKTVSTINGITGIHITTNGVLAAPYINELKQAGVKSVNLSLDTLDKERFKNITRRDEFDAVMETLNLLLAENIEVKLNTVVVEGKNIEDILPLVAFTQNNPVSIRFIEEMPFNGDGSRHPILNWTHHKIIDHIKSTYPLLSKLKDEANSTSYNYSIPGHRGNVGVIAAYSRTFCGTCDRIRITAQGTLKTCLYDNGVLNIRDLIRAGASDNELEKTLLKAFKNRAKDGFEAERNRNVGEDVSESMSTIGG